MIQYCPYHGKDMAHKAGANHALAHPDFRAELRKEAQQLFYSQGG
jgi:acyl-CoA hydrolase